MTSKNTRPHGKVKVKPLGVHVTIVSDSGVENSNQPSYEHLHDHDTKATSEHGSAPTREETQTGSNNFERPSSTKPERGSPPPPPSPVAGGLGDGGLVNDFAAYQKEMLTYVGSGTLAW